MSGTHLSPVDLDLLMLGLPDQMQGPQDELQKHSTNCMTCLHAKRQRLLDQQAFMQSGYSRGLARLQQHKQAKHRRWRWMLMSVAAPMLVAFAIFASNFFSQRTAVPKPAEDAVGIKGPAGLRLFARRAESLFPVEDGQRMMPGDALRFVLEPTSYPYLLIASIDGDGRASVYFPFEGEVSAHVPSGSSLEAPAGSVVLDQAQGPERIFAIWSEKPILSQLVMSALSELGRKGHKAIRGTTELDLPTTFQQSMLIEKSRGF